MEKVKEIGRQVSRDILPCQSKLTPKYVIQDPSYPLSMTKIESISHIFMGIKRSEKSEKGIEWLTF